MDILRRFAAEAPEPREFRQDKPILIMSWWCTIYSITAIFFRIIGRYVRTEKIYREDGVMLLAIVPLLMRMAFVHVVLVFGTNNTISTSLSPTRIRQREIGSQLVLAARVMYVTYIWAIKYSTSVFLYSLTQSTWKTSRRNIFRWLHISLAVTFVATIISILSTCQPFTHYWQVVPDPGPQCRQGYVFLLMMGVLNILTNLALVILPLPMVLKSKLPKKQKLSVFIRLALPLISVAFTLYQIPTVIDHHGLQSRRTLLASIDMLLATAVANAPVLVSLLQDRGFKKTKWKWEVVTSGSEGRVLRKVKIGWEPKPQNEEVNGMSKDKEQPPQDSLSKLKEIERGMEMDDLKPRGGRNGNNRVNVDVGVGVPENVKLGGISVATTWEVTEVSSSKR